MIEGNNDMELPENLLGLVVLENMNYWHFTTDYEVEDEDDE